VDMRAGARHERAVQTKGICARVSLALSLSLSLSPSIFLPFSLFPSRLPPTFSLLPSPSNPAAFLPRSAFPFALSFSRSRSFSPSARTHARTPHPHIRTRARSYAWRASVCARVRACVRACDLARSRGAVVIFLRSSLGRAHKSRGKERGHDIFQDGIFNALARSVTPGERGPAIGRPRRRSATNCQSLIGRAGP